MVLFSDRVRFAGQPIAAVAATTEAIAEQAGVTIFGPAINISTNESLPWNLARSIVFTKACSEAAEIPVHANLGMGVGGVPLNSIPPIDAVARASKAVVDITQLDGL